MSYIFDYDPNTDETPWPLAWKITPQRYNFEGTLGTDLFSIQIEAEPDPDYPDAWEDYHAATDAMGNPIAPPPLPPEPELEEYIIHIPEMPDDTSDMTDEELEELEELIEKKMDEEYYTVTFEDGVVFDEVDIRLFFPFKSIKYSKDGEVLEAETVEELFDSEFDYVTAFVPDERESIERFIEVEAISNAKTELRDRFWFLFNNNWREARDQLDELVKESEKYFDKLKDELGEGGEAGEPNESGEQESKFDPQRKEREETVRTFLQRRGISYDDLFREEDPEEINRIIDEEGGEEFLNKLISESQQDPRPVPPDNPFEDGVSMDEVLRENTVEELMERYNLTFEELLELLRNL